VFGSNDAERGDPLYELARQAGRCLAELGYTVVNGGYGGTMEASAMGAKQVGGSTIGVTCRVWSSSLNAYIDRRVSAASLPERLETLIALGTGGYVVLPGATGTLQELATVWERRLKGLLDDRPIVCVGSFWQPLISLMASIKPSSTVVIKLLDEPCQLAQCLPRRSV